MWKTLQGEPQFIIPVAEAQNVLDKFASSKINFVILNPFRQTHNIIQSFNQEMSLLLG